MTPWAIERARIFAETAFGIMHRHFTFGGNKPMIISNDDSEEDCDGRVATPGDGAERNSEP